MALKSWQEAADGTDQVMAGVGRSVCGPSHALTRAVFMKRTYGQSAHPASSAVALRALLTVTVSILLWPLHRIVRPHSKSCNMMLLPPERDVMLNAEVPSSMAGSCWRQIPSTPTVVFSVTLGTEVTVVTTALPAAPVPWMMMGFCRMAWSPSVLEKAKGDAARAHAANNRKNKARVDSAIVKARCKLRTAPLALAAQAHYETPTTRYYYLLASRPQS